MNREIIDDMMRRDREAWEELTAILDANPDRSLHEAGSPLWTSRDAYAHLARWMEYGTQAIKTLLAGGTVPERTETDDEINERWRREDSDMSLDETRQWAGCALMERERMLESVPESRWGGDIEKYARWNGETHFRDHISYITLTDDRPVPSTLPAAMTALRGGGMYEIVVENHFEAAHYLRGYQGKCEAMHGHRYRVVVHIEADQTNDVGLALDFTVVKKYLNAVLDRFDHTCLNDIAPFNEINPSAENIASTIFTEMAEKLAAEPARLTAVEAWETPFQGVIYRPA